MQRSAGLTRAERLLLLVPLAGGTVFGILPYFAQSVFAQVFGYSGDDPYLYRLAGAATVGYGVALAGGLRDGAWPPLRAVVVATLVFNLVSIGVCVGEIAGSRAQPIVYVILATSIFIATTTAWILSRHSTPASARDVATWVVVMLGLATAAAAVFGIAPLFSQLFSAALGYRGTDIFVIRQSGAATLGYAAMGVIELRSLRWAELRLPTAMALVFNGLSCVASLIELASHPTPVAALIAAASGAFSVGFVFALRRRGR